jgi:hypothetical protein
MIRLTCPSCKSELMIDEGFRGGVCRCFSCGTLMTVPEDPDHQQAESLKRPDAPTGPSTTTKSGAFARTGTFQTQSGRTVQLDTKQLSKIPVARKHRVGLRVTIYTAVALMMAAMVVIVVYAAATMMTQPTGPDTKQIYTDVFGITENPFLSANAQFMGSPITGPTVLMFDGSSAMSETADFVKAEAELAVKNSGDHPVQVIVWSERGPIVFPAALTPAKQIDQAALHSKLDDLLAEGALAPAPAMAAAVKSKPAHIILVLHDAPSDDELKSIEKQLKDAGVKLDVIQIGEESKPLANVAKDTGGKLLTITPGQLRRWHDEFLAKK